MWIWFFLLVNFRAIGGLRNGLGYGQIPVARKVCAWLLTAIAVGLAGWAYRHTRMTLDLNAYSTSLIAAGLALLAGLGGIWGAEAYFTGKSTQRIFRDLHFWELLIQPAFMVLAVLAGADVIYVAASVYPGLILHKGFVNIPDGNSFWYYGTDDATGKTFNLPILNIRIPRNTLAVRLYLAGASILYIILNETLLHWHVTWAQLTRLVENASA